MPIIELLDRRKHDRAQFSCGIPSLDDYLQKQVSQDIKKNIAQAFVLIEKPDSPGVLAYYTLSAYSVECVELDGAIAKKLPNYPRFPATLLGRLAVDQTQQGKGYGELMLIDALKRSWQISKQVASLAVVVDALDEQAAKFYQKYGFQAVVNQPLKLYIPMKTVASLFS